MSAGLLDRGARRRVSVMLLAAVVRLYPRRFRQRFATEMVEVFSERVAEIRASGGPAGVLGLWFRTFPELVRGAVSERRDERRASRRSLRHASPGLPRKEGNPMDRLNQDFLYALRTLVRSRAFATVAVLTLGLGIGVNTAVFSLVNAFLFRPLPGVEKPEELAAMFTGEGDWVGVSAYMDYLDFRERTQAFARLAAYKPLSMDLSDEGSTERIAGMIVTANYFETLGVKPELGRFFLPEDDDEPGGETVAVVSHDLWQSVLGGDPGAIGATLRLNGLTFTVIGVAPPGFRGAMLGRRPQVFAPMMMQPHFMPSSGMLLDRRGWGGIFVIGRLADGVSLQEARTDVARVGAWLKETYPDYAGYREYRLEPFAQATLVPGDRALVVRLSQLLIGVMAGVLLIACVNVANLMLARAMGRRRELAVRNALGAGRGRRVLQLLIESLTLSSIGGLLGVALAFSTQGIFRALPFPYELDIALDVRVLGFALAASLLTGIAFGVAPALRATRLDLSSQMRPNVGDARHGRQSLLAGGMVVAQVALSLVLLVAAGLFARTLVELASVDLGFDADNVLVATVDPALQGYEGAEIQSYYRAVMERIDALPGVTAASLASSLPIGGDDVLIYNVEGFKSQEERRIGFNLIGVDYFQTMGIPIVSGRAFTAADDGRGEPVLIVNETGARQLQEITNRDAIGARVSFDGPDGPFLRVVGVAADSKIGDLRSAPGPLAYIAHLQVLARGGGSRMNLLLRTGSTAALSVVPSVRAALRAVDPNVPPSGFDTLSGTISVALLPERLSAALLGVAALLALALASVGLYGLLSYAVSRRSGEMGIRMALGARAAHVRRLVVRQGLLLVGLGAGIGLMATLAAGSLLSSFLYGVASTDPVTYALVVVVLALVAVAASWVPARRATRVDPLQALRGE